MPSKSPFRFVPNGRTRRVGIPTLGAALLASALAIPGGPPAAAAEPSPSVSSERIELHGDGLQPLEPSRLLDTRASGATVDGQAQAGGVVAAGAAITLVVAGRGGVPSVGAGAVVLNVTVTEAQGTGHLTVYPTGSARPNTSNLNFSAGQSVPNLVLAKLGVDGRIDLAPATTTHVLADVVGWLPETRDVQTVQPARVMDTRGGGQTVDGQSQSTGALRAGETRRLLLAGRAGVPMTGTGAVVLNVTAVGPTAGGYLTVHPTGVTRPNSSSLNFTAGQIVPNLVVAKLGTDGAVSVFNSAGSTSVLADVVGWMPADASYRPLTPARILDTRPIGQTIDNRERAAGAIAAAQARRLPVLGRGGVPASGVAAVVFNLTGTAPTSVTHLTVYPAGSSVPNASNLNLARGATRANLVFAKIGSDGAIDIRNAAGSTHALADVVGYFPSAGTNLTTMSLKPGTVLAGPGDIVSSTGSADAGAVVVLGPTANVPPLDGHLFVGPNQQVRSGISGRVTEIVRNADGSTRLTLAPAHLQDMFTELKIKAAMDGPRTAQALTAAAQRGRAHLEGAGCTGSGAPTGISLPSLSFENAYGAFDFDLWGGTSSLLLRVTPTLTWNIGYNGSFGCSIALPGVPLPIGPLLIEISPQISADLQAQAAGSVALHFAAPLTFGYDYANGSATSLNSATGSATAVPEGGGSTLSIRVSAGAVVSAKLGGVAGISADAGPSLVYTIGEGCKRLGIELQIGLSAIIGRWGIEWGFDLARFSTGPVPISEDCTAPSPSPTPTSSPSPAANARPVSLRMTRTVPQWTQTRDTSTAGDYDRESRSSSVTVQLPAGTTLRFDYDQDATSGHPANTGKPLMVTNATVDEVTENVRSTGTCVQRVSGFTDAGGEWYLTVQVATRDGRQLDQAKPGETVYVRWIGNVYGTSTYSSSGASTFSTSCGYSSTGKNGLFLDTPRDLPQGSCPEGTVMITYRGFDGTNPRNQCGIPAVVAADGSVSLRQSGQGRDSWQTYYVGDSYPFTYDVDLVIGPRPS